MGRLYTSTSFRPIINDRLEPVFDDKEQRIIVGRTKREQKKEGDEGLLDLGVVCEKQASGRSFHGYRVHMDAKFPHIVFICGKRGGGKSYTLGVMAEELCRTKIGIGTVIVDPIGIYWSMKKENQNKKELQELSRWGLKPSGLDNIRILVPLGLYDENDVVDGSFSIKPSELSSEEWCLVFGLDRFKTQGLLIGEALEKVREGYRIRKGPDEVEHIPGRGGSYDIGDIIEAIDGDIDLGSDAKGYARTTRRSVIARFKAAGRWGIFSEQGTPIEEISVWDTVTVIDVSHPNLENQIRALIVGILAQKILQARMLASRREQMGTGGDGSEIPVTWLMIDEAHLLIPRRGLTAASKPLIDYAKLGRKPGCALVLATQRPAATDDDILSQIDILIGHSLGLEDDIGALLKRVPSKLPHQMAQSDFIRGIPAGSALLADQKTQQRAMLIRVRPRFSHHSGKEATPERRVVPTESLAEKGEGAADEPKPEEKQGESEDDEFEIMAASSDTEVEPGDWVEEMMDGVDEEQLDQSIEAASQEEEPENVPPMVLGEEVTDDEKDYADDAIMDQIECDENRYDQTDEESYQYEEYEEPEPPSEEEPEEPEAEESGQEEAEEATQTFAPDLPFTGAESGEEVLSFPLVLRESSVKGLTIKDLKTSWTGKPKEFVESIDLVHLPMYQVEMQTVRKKFITGNATVRCELLCDTNLIEMVVDFNDFKRTTGLSRLADLEKPLLDVLSCVLRGEAPELCEDDLGLSADEISEALDKLSSKGLIELKRDKKGFLIGSLTDKVDYQQRPERVDGELPSSSYTKAETLLPERIDADSLEDFIERIYPEYQILSKNKVYMPYYRITYSSEEGSRRSYINGFTGLFENISPEL